MERERDREGQREIECYRTKVPLGNTVYFALITRHISLLTALRVSAIKKPIEVGSV